MDLLSVSSVPSRCWAIGGIALGLMDTLKCSIAGGASYAWEKGGLKPCLLRTSYRAHKAAGRSSLSEKIETARSISNSDIIDLGQRGLAILVAALTGAVIWVDGTRTVVARLPLTN